MYIRHLNNYLMRLKMNTTSHEAAISYNQLKEKFTTVYYKLDISQLHGYLSGCITVNNNISLDQCIDYLSAYYGQDKALKHLKSDILELYSQIIISLQDSNLTAELFIAGDDNLLDIQLKSLALWCQGFIDGFYDVIGSSTTKLSESINNSLVDIAKVATINYAEYTDCEDDKKIQEGEQNFINVREFMKLSWISLYLDMQILAKDTTNKATTENSNE